MPAKIRAISSTLWASSNWRIHCFQSVNCPKSRFGVWPPRLNQLWPMLVKFRQDDRAQLPAARPEAVIEAGDIRGVEAGQCQVGAPQRQQEGSPGGERDEEAGHHRESAGERDWGGVDLAVAGVVHEAGPEAPATPQRQGQEAGQEGAGKGAQVQAEGEVGHGQGQGQGRAASASGSG